MDGHVVLRLALDLAPSDRGGRRRPMVDGDRGSMSFGRRRRGIEPIVHDAVLVLEDADQLAPGERGIARAWVLMPDELPRSLDPGDVFTLLENDRIIGRAELLETLRDSASQPLGDLTAAKTRALQPAPGPPTA